MHITVIYDVFTCPTCRALAACTSVRRSPYLMSVLLLMCMSLQLSVTLLPSLRCASGASFLYSEPYVPDTCWVRHVMDNQKLTLRDEYRAARTFAAAFCTNRFYSGSIILHCKPPSKQVRVLVRHTPQDEGSSEVDETVMTS